MDKIIEIKGSPVKLIVLAIGSAAATILSVAIFMGKLPGVRSVVLDTVLGGLAVVVFAVGTLVAITRLLVARRTVITIAPEGLRDIRVASNVIPWTAIQNISTWQFGLSEVVVVAVDPAMEARLDLTPIARLSRTPNKALGADGLCLTLQGLAVKGVDLLETTKAYRARYGAPAAI